MTAENPELSSSLAKAVVDYLSKAIDPPFAFLTAIEVRAAHDVLHILLEPEIPQHPAVPLLAHEPVTLLFNKADAHAPHVYSARADFPLDLDLVHTNRDAEGDGVALCIWEENWDNLSRTLTGQALVERLRRWFAQTASGDVHPADQGLEPLLPMNVHTLVMPAGHPEGPWHLVRGSDVEGRITLVLETGVPAGPMPSLSFALFELRLPPVVHGALRTPPSTLAGLVALIGDLGGDLLTPLQAWLREPAQCSNAAAFLPLLLIVIPMKRSDEDAVEGYEVWGYGMAENMAVIGEHLGATFTADIDGKSVTQTALGKAPGDMDALKLMPWRVVHQLDRALARAYAATTRSEDATLVAIGAGAIGSNLVSNSVKAGIGRWTIIDHDIVLPHNTVRQTQGMMAVGLPKAEALRWDADRLLAESGSVAICADFLHPGEFAAEIATGLDAADLAIDLSASPAVVGHLADHPDVQRAASFFFSPDGSDLVVLAEDADRTLRLDEIEAQYFLASGASALLRGHLAAARVDRVRYANACQDLTRPLAPWQVQMLSGLATGRLLRILDAAEASAQVWRLCPDTGLVIPVPIDMAGVYRVAGEETRVSISKNVVASMRDYRAAQSPNETGGILIGSFDLKRNILHIVSALPAPADSEQSPTYFVRGARDLRPLMDDLAEQSAGQLHYVGEWHSHPDGAAARPSGEDEQLFSYLGDHIGPGGYPFAMMICGADDSWVRVGWQGRAAVEGVVDYGED